MRIRRLSGADYAERFDGGFGLDHDGRWNERGRLVTYCATGPALCVLEKLVHVENANLLPDDTVLVRYHVPDDIPDADDRNIIVNHRHQDAVRITISGIEKFEYDPRLFVSVVESTAGTHTRR